TCVAQLLRMMSLKSSLNTISFSPLFKRSRVEEISSVSIGPLSSWRLWDKANLGHQHGVMSENFHSDEDRRWNFLKWHKKS
ncbi:hypothetical protein CEXT_753791, partial [Caerostris extrusa]